MVGGWLERVEGLFGFGGDGDAGMEKFGEDFQAGHQARAGAGKVGIGVHEKSLVVAYGGHLLPFARKSDRAVLGACLFGVVAARRYYDNLGLCGDDVFERQAEGGGAQFSENVAGAGELDHFGDPVAADVDGLEPFEKGDAGAADSLRDLGVDGSEFFADGFEEMFGGVAVHGFVADPENVSPDVAKVERIEGQYFRPIIKGREYGGKIFRRGRANTAQILGNDKVRGETFEGFGIHSVDAFAAGSEFADQAVDFDRTGVFRKTGVDDYGFAAGRGWVVAFVADTNDLVAETEGEEDFCGGGEKGDDALRGHYRTLAQWEVLWARTGQAGFGGTKCRS